MEDFAADTISIGMLLAFTRRSQCEMGHLTQWQASRQQALGIRIPPDQHYLLPLCSKATGDVTVIVRCHIILLQKSFVCFIFMVDE